MKTEDDIERILADTPLPFVRDGDHRRRLKARLMQCAEGRQTRAGDWQPPRQRRMLRVAVMVIAAVGLVTVGWAGERVYEYVAKTHFFSVTESRGEWEIVTPDGKKQTFTRTSGYGVDYDPSVGPEESERKLEEVKELIAKGEYELVGTFHPARGKTIYKYSFVLSDGEDFTWNLLLPLDGAASWEDYRERVRQAIAERDDRIAEAISAGRFRLIDADVIRSHVCRDAGSGELINVMHVSSPVPDRPDAALVKPYPLTSGGNGYHMSWQDHLKAIAEGRRELIRLETVKEYTYELVLSDGSRIDWSVAQDTPFGEQAPEETKTDSDQ